jgi:hypothetical protein
MILENDSLPEPLSPVIKTVMSVGATCSAIEIACNREGAFPIIPNLAFNAVK